MLACGWCAPGLITSLIYAHRDVVTLLTKCMCNDKKVLYNYSYSMNVWWRKTMPNFTIQNLTMFHDINHNLKCWSWSSLNVASLKLSDSHLVHPNSLLSLKCLFWLYCISLVTETQLFVIKRAQFLRQIYTHDAYASLILFSTEEWL